MIDPRQHPPLPKPKKPLGLLATSVVLALCYMIFNELKHPGFAFACMVFSILGVVVAVLKVFHSSKTSSVHSDHR